MIKASKQANKEKDSQTNCQMSKQPNNDKTKTKNLTDKQNKNKNKPVNKQNEEFAHDCRHRNLNHQTLTSFLLCFQFQTIF